MTDPKWRWAATRRMHGGERDIITETIALTKSGAITNVIEYGNCWLSDCKSRAAKWRKLKAHEQEFMVEEVIIKVLGEDEEEESGRRCCDNCFYYYKYSCNGENVHRCNDSNFPKLRKGAIIDSSRFVCRYHKTYEEVFLNR